MVLLAAIEAVLLGSHVLHGGLYTDDWPLASIQRQYGTWGLFDNLISANHGRPLAALYLSLTTALIGTDPHLHPICGLLTLLAAASALYLLLRLLSLRVREALAVVLLFVVFPFSDSAWLWSTASHSYLAIALAALGGALALIGLQRKGRIAIAYHAGALVLFTLSILTYQTAALVICLSLFIYLPRVSRRLALALWASDVCVVALTLTLPRLITGSAGTTADQIISLSSQVHHARLMANQGLTLLTTALIPFGDPRRNVVLPIALVIVVGGTLLARRASGAPALRRDLCRLLLLSLAGALIVAAAYAVYVPAPVALYQPLAKGSENRVNVMASIGYALLVYALAMTAARIIVRLFRRSPTWAPTLGIAIIAVIFVGYMHRTRQDIAAWDRAGSIQRQDISGLQSAGRPASGTTIYAFGGIGATAPYVFAFRVTWDLNSAVQLLWKDGTLHAYPIFTGTQIRCTATQVVPTGFANGNSAAQAGNYGQVTFFDFRNHQQQRVTDTKTCAEALTRFVPGPVEG